MTVLSAAVADVFSFNSLVSFISSSFTGDIISFSAEMSVAAVVLSVSVTAKSVSIS